MSARIIVVGSLNMDFVVQVERLPAPGETVTGHGFQMTPGGKGANQACAAARLGGSVAMIGRAGNDVFGDRLKAGLAAVGVDVARVQTTPSEPTGVALIAVERSGQNTIVIAAGANGKLGPAVAINSSGTLAQPAGLIPGVPSEPARTGSTIIILATGLGPTDSPVEDGHNSLDRLRRTTTVPTVLIGGRDARVLFSGLSPEFVGVYQINAEVPTGVSSSDAAPLQIQVGGVTTSDRVTIAVRP
jgi:uncharacterized protein (TIGR03437 family)